ncbi:MULTISPECIES: hypothetical protein [unclassified Acinetobacter]|uniref:hypothetical protein n=1 Tax=unclassified Acinetobacter TaxID=196816 RepID=UPI0015D1A100|nr:MULTISPECIES: hypothetical protein [unclassified Acinetobacter]
MQFNSIKKICLTLSLTVMTLTGCQIVSPIFVDYNGVRRDVATWINKQPLLSMQQKRSMAQLSRAQQPIIRLDFNDQEKLVSVARANEAAMYCANQYLSARQIQRLQKQIFPEDALHKLSLLEQQALHITLTEQEKRCD